MIMAFQSQRQFSSARTHTADEYSMGRSACAASRQVQELSSASGLVRSSDLPTAGPAAAWALNDACGVVDVCTCP